MCQLSVGRAGVEVDDTPPCRTGCRRSGRGWPRWSRRGPGSVGPRASAAARTEWRMRPVRAAASGPLPQTSPMTTVHGAVSDLEHVVEVAADLDAGLRHAVASSDVERGDLGQRRRQQRGLQHARHPVPRRTGWRCRSPWPPGRRAPLMRCRSSSPKRWLSVVDTKRAGRRAPGRGPPSARSPRPGHPPGGRGRDGRGRRLPRRAPSRR